ncbi:hypothetical protein CMK14_24390 [Candidatus Poribacteria bacterium]|nr:hypothetical protein [Candidatus Poribacteria bacterium]
MKVFCWEDLAYSTVRKIQSAPGLDDQRLSTYSWGSVETVFIGPGLTAWPSSSTVGDGGIGTTAISTRPADCVW